MQAGELASSRASTGSDVQGRINAYWDERGPSYDAQPGHGLRNEREHRAWLDGLAALLPPAPCDVLDVGTGTGFLAMLLAELGHRVIGVDLAEGMLAVARAKVARVGSDAPQFRAGDAMDPPLPAASVDVVISRHVLWTLPDTEAAFTAWRRLVRPGGRVVAIDALWKLPSAQTQTDGGAAGVSGAGDKPLEPWREAWAKHYSSEVQSRLPLFNAETLDPAVTAAKAAGFSEVTVSGLDEVERVEQELDPTRGPKPPRYVLTARLP